MRSGTQPKQRYRKRGSSGRKGRPQNVGGYRIRFRSSWVHRTLWRAFFMPKISWRWQRFYPAFAVAASYLAPLSMPLLRALLRDKPDFIVTQDYSSGKFDILVAIARVLGVPVVARHAGSSPDLYLARFIKRWTIPFGEQSAFEP